MHRGLPSPRSIDSQTKALIAARAALEKQAEGVIVMDLRALSTVTDVFVVCTASSPPQMKAIQEHIEEALSSRGCAVWHTEGTIGVQRPSSRFEPEPLWLLMDCGDVVVHILDGAAREFYQLERLWGDAPRIPVGDAPPAASRGRSSAS